jgi:hypothetical protein
LSAAPAVQTNRAASKAAPTMRGFIT